MDGLWELSIYEETNNFHREATYVNAWLPMPDRGDIAYFPSVRPSIVCEICIPLSKS